MKRAYFLLWLTGTLLLAGGCLLPWEIAGELDTAATRGIQLFPEIEDNGGATVLGLGVAIGLLSFKPKKLVDHSEIWRLVLSIILVLLCSLYFLRGILHQIAIGNVMTARVLGIGLVLILLGSILLLVFSSFDMPKRTQKQGRRSSKSI